ncbi:hypothetical protein [Candidatus Contendibacter odensensis]|uniref:Uncharacterized protein n=1 Tax=Candidatus Contendobacter odensis Run_B_J11 TaxID=1400861 RepID=A0A7U7J6B7_9GAMM|nr:hypothetical protein [Candidatus Contendobacter odensis]CDH47716.1 conserved hypothetical protein [Candidatus Contendobacter odensis Run_B_J11]
MPGLVKKMIDAIVLERSKGNVVIANSTRTKLLLKGIDPLKYTPTTEDDAAIIAKVRTAALDFGVRLS